ncbi:hypothetical protein Clacol_008912 [Clathrus columnatus]|uniref:WW domain-containing protein n=1 Tax=Clathrus columnatus TaxID=1419009 RepID=A0AAV5AQJ1_9AGAM|nr:hypothetical protein Clacol_008912 [Clathrus columnatus]
MSSDDSRATSVSQSDSDDIPKASTSKSASGSLVDTSETDPKEVQGSHKNDEDDEEEQEEDEQGAKSKETDEANTDSKELSTQINTPATASVTAGDWQALWSPQHNAYYFYNARTNETTWTNPLQPQAESNEKSVTMAGSSSSSSLYPPSTASLYAAAEAAGIDPSLAHLDPTLVMPGGAPSGVFTAKFNARTGAFTRMDGRDPSFLSEAERAKRMSDVYFDVNAWETELEQRYEEEAVNGKKRKRPSKKDLEKFKEQKRLKKIAKTAWLRT